VKPFLVALTALVGLVLAANFWIRHPEWNWGEKPFSTDVWAGAPPEERQAMANQLVDSKMLVGRNVAELKNVFRENISVASDASYVTVLISDCQSWCFEHLLHLNLDASGQVVSARIRND
jgi:hypothetical protein